MLRSNHEFRSVLVAEKIAENTINAALRSLGQSKEQGFWSD